MVSELPSQLLVIPRRNGTGLVWNLGMAGTIEQVSGCQGWALLGKRRNISLKLLGVPFCHLACQHHPVLPAACWWQCVAAETGRQTQGCLQTPFLA